MAYNTALNIYDHLAYILSFTQPHCLANSDNIYLRLHFYHYNHTGYPNIYHHLLMLFLLSADIAKSRKSNHLDLRLQADSLSSSYNYPVTQSYPYY